MKRREGEGGGGGDGGGSGGGRGGRRGREEEGRKKSVHSSPDARKQDMTVSK